MTGDTGAPGSGDWCGVKFENGNYGLWFCGRNHPTTGKVHLWLKVKNGGSWSSDWKFIYNEQ